jgi:hypothetical protein
VPDPEGPGVYYWHVTTGATSWDRPAVQQAMTAIEQQQPPEDATHTVIAAVIDAATDDTTSAAAVSGEASGKAATDTTPMTGCAEAETEAASTATESTDAEAAVAAAVAVPKDEIEDKVASFMSDLEAAGLLADDDEQEPTTTTTAMDEPHDHSDAVGVSAAAPAAPLELSLPPADIAVLGGLLASQLEDALGYVPSHAGARISSYV